MDLSKLHPLSSQSGKPKFAFSKIEDREVKKLSRSRAYRCGAKNGMRIRHRSQNTIKPRYPRTRATDFYWTSITQEDCSFSLAHKFSSSIPNLVVITGDYVFLSPRKGLLTTST
eukprot:scaffold137152_cov37-Tisochrysis_lutea.AAC.2